MNLQPKTNKAVLYVRVSSKEQDKEGFSIPAQYKLLRDYATANRLEIIHEFEDVETASHIGREQFRAMIAFLKKTPDCRDILVEKTDRLFRNIPDWSTVDTLGVDIHLVKDGGIIGPNSKSGDKFVYGIKVLMAKNYTDNLSEEARKGMLQKAREGYWPSMAPLGYLNVTGANGKKTIEPDPQKAPIITRLFEQYATGIYAVKDIAKVAKEAGLVSRNTKTPLHIGTIYWILTTRTYSGNFDWKGQTYKGNYPAIVPLDLWNKVQEVIKRRSNGKMGKSRYHYTYNGLVHCGHCGCILTTEHKKNMKYIYYHCTGWKGKCPGPWAREETLTEMFAEHLKAIQLPPEVLKWLKVSLRSSHDDKKEHHDEAIALLQAEYDRLQKRLDAMYEDKLDGRVDQDLFDRKSREWRAEQARILADVQRHQNADENYIEQGIKLLERASQAYDLFLEQPPSEKRKLIQFAFSGTTWKDGILNPSYRQPFGILAISNRKNPIKKAVGGSSDGKFEKWLGR